MQLGTQQPAVLMLSVYGDKQLSDLARQLHGHLSARNKKASLSVCVHGTLNIQLSVLTLDSELGERCEQLVRQIGKQSRNSCAVLAATYKLTPRTLSREQFYRVDEHRLSRTCLSGYDGKPLAEVDIGAAHYRDIFYM